MRKELRQRAEKYAYDSLDNYVTAVVFTQRKVDMRDDGFRYFFAWADSHDTAKRFKNQKELDEFLTSEGY